MTSQNFWFLWKAIMFDLRQLMLILLYQLIICRLSFQNLVNFLYIWCTSNTTLGTFKWSPTHCRNCLSHKKNVTSINPLCISVKLLYFLYQHISCITLKSSHSVLTRVGNDNIWYWQALWVHWLLVRVQNKKWQLNSYNSSTVRAVFIWDM